MLTHGKAGKYAWLRSKMDAPFVGGGIPVRCARGSMFGRLTEGIVTGGNANRRILSEEPPKWLAPCAVFGGR